MSTGLGIDQANVSEEALSKSPFLDDLIDRLNGALDRLEKYTYTVERFVDRLEVPEKPGEDAPIYGPKQRLMAVERRLNVGTGRLHLLSERLELIG